MLLVSQNYCPKTHPHEVAYEFFPGTPFYCKRYGDETDDGYDFKAVCPTHKGKTQGVNNEAYPPIVNAQFNGVRICGKRGGLPFMNAVRNQDLVTPDSCPSGYLPCGSGQVENTWCVESKTECPVTGIRLIN